MMNHLMDQGWWFIPLPSSDVKPFHVSTERMTAGQNGATLSDQSAVLMSCQRQRPKASVTPNEHCSCHMHPYQKHVQNTNQYDTCHGY